MATFFPEWEKIRTFIDGLNEVVRPLVARYRNFTGTRCSFEKIVHYSQDEGYTYRSRRKADGRPECASTAMNSSQNLAQKRMSTRNLACENPSLLLESSGEFRYGILAGNAGGKGRHEADLHLIVGTSDNTLSI